MIRIYLSILAVAVCIVGVSRSDDVKPKDTSRDSKAIEGLWSGSWGGGERPGGVIFQPNLAEIVLKGDHVELSGFPNVGNLTGTLRLDASAKRIYITRTDKPGGKDLEYGYEVDGDKLTLTDTARLPIIFQRCPVAEKPLANAQVDLVEATGINDAGDLLVNEFTVLRAGGRKTEYFQPQKRTLKTKQAIVLVVQETGCKKISIKEARGLVREPKTVAVTYRHDDRPAPSDSHQLWKETRPPTPDSDAVLQTFSRTLRPGTLVFILSAKENVPMP